LAYCPLTFAAQIIKIMQKVIVHRKGATSAKAGETGIISGSQGTKSYIVVGGDKGIN
jgi:tRNA-splicing ligase RtcB